MNKRAEYTSCSNEKNERIQKVREEFSNLYNFIEENCKSSRETSLCLTKLEEAQFWSIKGISRED